MRRLLVPLAVAFALWIPVAAVAGDSLEDLMEDAGEGEYHGLGIVMCTWGVDSAAATYSLERSGGMSMVHAPDRELMLHGSTVAVGSDAAWNAFEVNEWSEWSLSDRYSLGEASPTTRLGRPATAVTIFEGDIPRARLVIDDASTVPLVTEILDAEGRVFRLAAMLEFEEGPGEPMAMPEEFDRMTVMEPAAPSPRLPGSVAGYDRADSYRGPGETHQSFYSDGLFSFSVFESKRGRTPDEFARATVFQVDGRSYRRVVTPTSVWIYWNSPDRSYVLVGDLPPDHIASVLAGLPDPGDRGFFVRLWRRLFG